MARRRVRGLFKAAPLVKLLERVGVTRASVIRVTGPGSLSPLLWLCRHGFQQVGYVRAGEGWPHEEPDAILAAHTCNELDLKRLLAVARQVRAGGVFLFQVRTDGGTDLLAIEWMLGAAGFEIARRLEGGHRALFVARRRAIAIQKAA